MYVYAVYCKWLHDAATALLPSTQHPLSLSLFDSLTAAYSQSHSQVQFTLGSHHHVVYLYINASEERKKQNEILYV